MINIAWRYLVTSVISEIVHLVLQGQDFSTVDFDNDATPNRDCADEDNAGWWYSDCGCGNLNRQSRPKWYFWKAGNDDIIYSEVKIPHYESCQPGIVKLNWVEYENGFGKPDSEFWLGNKVIHELSKRQVEVQIVLKSRSNLTGPAKYSCFKVHGRNDKYRLEISGYVGDIGDCASSSSGQDFSTVDFDNDATPNRDCADEDNAGWWYSDCGCGNLNRQSRPKWYFWKAGNDDIIYSEVKIR
ncbi:angiopoietin-related protein 6-like [Porites lutea]|uniref:angiopoietin-related protein 6-like n=1 Tax=Porites lutea TaxID=51062 RepID=UPI003CC6D902